MELHCKEVAHNSEAYWQTVALRDEVLRKPLNMEFDKNELLKEDDSHHLVAYFEGKPVGCMILKPLDEQTIKMRQVVTAPDFQRKGVGQTLVAYAEQFAWDKGYTNISLHARLSAVPFYEKLNYEVIGDLFEEVGIPHYKMMKQKD